MEKHKDIFQSVSEYYSNRIREYGAAPKGVDWNGVESQTCRFEQLSKILPETNLNGNSVLDFGCGYAAFLDYLEQNYQDYEYRGLDISAEMIDAASKRHAGRNNLTFEVGASISQAADYIVGSGIFNVKLDSNVVNWEEYFLNTLDELNRHSIKGFAFNCLTSYSDKDKMKSHLYYPSPEKVFQRCKERYSRNVALLHDYDLYEFTVLVRK